MKRIGRSILSNAAGISNFLYLLIALLGFVLVWYGTIYLLSVPNFLLPKPDVVIREIIFRAPLLYRHMQVTLNETLLGFFLAIVVSVPVSVAVVWWKPVEKTLVPIMVFLQTVPKIAVAPLFIVWFGFGYVPKILISFLLAYFPIVIEMITGMRDVPFEMLDLAKSMSATAFQQFVKIRIPNSLPYFFNGLKLGMLLSLTGAITAEFMGSTEGLGYLIMYANVRLNTPLLFAVLIILLILGKVAYSVVEWVERAAVSWHVVFREREKVQFTV